MKFRDFHTTPAFLETDPPKLVMTPDEGVALGQKILDLVTSPVATVKITHTMRGTTQVGTERVLGGNDGEYIDVNLLVRSGFRNAIWAKFNQIDDASLRLAVKHIESLERQQAGDPDSDHIFPRGPREYQPVQIWFPKTAGALAIDRHTVAPTMIQTIREHGCTGAAFMGGVARTHIVMVKDGHTARSAETDVECSVRVRTPSGLGVGWYGQASRNWETLTPVEVAERAVAFARRADNPVAYEPGRRTAILSHFAVAQLVRRFGGEFDFDFRLPERPLYLSPAGTGTKVGLRVFDERIRIESDPIDPLGGYAPFDKDDGLPIRRIVWVERGVLETMAYSAGEGLARGRQSHPAPAENVRLSAEPGTETMTVDEMIASCDHGIYVHRFSDLRSVDLKSGVLTGVTRDGCFLIRRGKLEKALRNFRFTDSPFLFLNRILAIGTPERAAVGADRHVGSWPYGPVIAPPIMVQDFNFSALADAV